VDGFRKFVLRGNVVDLAVAVVIGAAFGLWSRRSSLPSSLPWSGLATGAVGDFTEATGEVGGVEFPYGRSCRRCSASSSSQPSCTSSSCSRSTG
jgi:large-conductance mechanosensitive channel